MTNYIDGFVFPIKNNDLDEYKKIASQIAEIWKENGAVSYNEFVGDDLVLKGTKSFKDVIKLKEDETVIFGWVAFPSKEIRDAANKQVPLDSRIQSLVQPLIDPNKTIFDSNRMVYGGFNPLIQID